MKDLNEVMLNPVRMRIVQEVFAGQSVTATELCEKISDVPRTTMYRHINILLDANILTVVSEQRVRGSVERTFALNTGQLARNNSLENAAQNALGFLMNKYSKLSSYFSGENPDPAKDRVFLNNFVLMLDDHEFDQFLLELRGLILRYYNFDVADGRRARDISLISAPTGLEC